MQKQKEEGNHHSICVCVYIQIHLFIFFLSRFYRALALKALDMRLSRSPPPATTSAEPTAAASAAFNSQPDVLFDAEQNTPSNVDLNLK